MKKKFFKNINIKKVVIYIFFVIIILYFLFKKNIFFEKYENNGIPKKIFTYWNEEKITNIYVQKNFEYLRKIIPPDYQFIVYNEKTIMDELGEDIKYNNHNKSTPTNFSDFVRYYLLYKYGGVWIDSTFIILNFDKVITDKYKNYEKNQFNAGYYEFSRHNVGKRVSDKHYESWFIIAPPQDPYIKDVLDEFKKGSNIGFPKYKKELRDEKINLKNLIDDEDDYYLMIYAMTRKVLKEKPKYKIESFDMNKVYLDKWDKGILDDLLYIDIIKNYEAIKLTRFHRDIIQQNNVEDKFFETLDKYYINK